MPSPHLACTFLPSTCPSYKRFEQATDETHSISTAAALVLDVYVLRRSLRRGRYNQMQDLDDKRGFPLQDNGAWRTSTEDLVPREPPHAARMVGGQHNGEESRNMLQQKYELPEEQFGRYDTEYHGSASH